MRPLNIGMEFAIHIYNYTIVLLLFGWFEKVENAYLRLEFFVVVSAMWGYGV